MKCMVGSSVNPDAKLAGKEAAAAAKFDEAKVALAYGSVAYDINAMMAGVTEALPGVPVVGNTSFTGVVTPEGFADAETGFVGVMTIGGDVTVGAAGLAFDGDARETGRKVAQAALKNAGKTDAPDYFYLAASSGEEESYMKGIADVIGRVPVFGGTAADNSIAGEWLLYENNTVFDDGVAVAFFWGGEMTNLFTGAYRETEDVGVITKVDGKRTLVEIDGVPAVEKYAEWTSTAVNDLAGGNLLSATVTSPLGVKDRMGDLIAIRHPMNGNDDGSMAIGSNLCEKTAVIRMEASVDELISAASDTLVSLRDSLPNKAAGYHLVHCGGRRAGIDARMGEVVEAVKKEAGDVPFIMEFTFGEYGYVEDHGNTAGGLMLSYTALMD